MHLKLPHSFSRQEAVARVERLLLEAKPQLADKVVLGEERWEGDVLHFAFSIQGKSISGRLEVHDKEYELHAKLPLMMRMFEGRIEKMIAEQSKQMLG
ncbi:hypothetical protein A2680_00510 [Candidatus Kaiserbacteria bacterium RIFCSPHIGHO2_01_FULL_55_37]|nr:MAG: hypothetical protein A2680_00510 [Candidatus Kaiserbacteria bacterium RIFCSPHIGHO2_01_FULL_55_37]